MFLPESQGFRSRSHAVTSEPRPRDSTPLLYQFSRDAGSLEQLDVSSNQNCRVIVPSVIGAALGVFALGFLGFYIYRRRSTRIGSQVDDRPLTLSEALSLDPPSYFPRSRSHVSPFAEPLHFWPGAGDIAPFTLPRRPRPAFDSGSSVRSSTCFDSSISISLLENEASIEQSDRAGGVALSQIDISDAHADPRHPLPSHTRSLSGGSCSISGPQHDEYTVPVVEGGASDRCCAVQGVPLAAAAASPCSRENIQNLSSEQRAPTTASQGLAQARQK